MSILAYNIATDHMFGVQAQTIATDFEKIFEINPHMYLGGQPPDEHPDGAPAFSCPQEPVRGARKPPDDARTIRGHAVQLSVREALRAVLYRAGYRRTGPQVVRAVHLQHGPDRLSEQAERLCRGRNLCRAAALVNAFDWDAISGWGATVHIIEKEKLTVKKLKTRMDKGGGCEVDNLESNRKTNGKRCCSFRIIKFIQLNLIDG
ncbi:proteasome subunit beta type 3 [Culex quinquefasciatus]|uniref:Proteasome subunit beta type 3 n=1 Tax=Culex quinquefasciatus TaxID=7176 RepID=B0X9Q9_CULQU|nr:proteasome subunit beta type 3 [Culex quinquefasciatus]|eukprot:XP_001866381.1 proteasome subunit beta type 3 [Culex quinquefasciatus]